MWLVSAKLIHYYTYRLTSHPGINGTCFFDPFLINMRLNNQRVKMFWISETSFKSQRARNVRDIQWTSSGPFVLVFWYFHYVYILRICPFLLKQFLCLHWAIKKTFLRRSQHTKGVPKRRWKHLLSNGPHNIFLKHS